MKYINNSVIMPITSTTGYDMFKEIKGYVDFSAVSLHDSPDTGFYINSEGLPSLCVVLDRNAWEELRNNITMQRLALSFELPETYWIVHPKNPRGSGGWLFEKRTVEDDQYIMSGVWWPTNKKDDNITKSFFTFPTYDFYAYLKDIKFATIQKETNVIKFPELLN